MERKMSPEEKWTKRVKSKLRLVLRKNIPSQFINSEEIEKIVSETFE